MMMAYDQRGFLGINLRDLTSCQKLLNNDREGQIKVLMLKQWLNLAEKIMPWVPTERWCPKVELSYNKHFYMIYRLEDIAKVLNLTFKTELNFNLPKTEISNFYNKLDVPRNPGI